MKQFLKFFIPLLIFGGIWYQYRGLVDARLTPVLDQITAEFGFGSAPCSNPITYTLGTFDTRFGISQKYFLSALSDAEVIWEKPFGKDLFSYKKDAQGNNVLKVNLVYDYRQQATSKLANLGIAVKDDKASYDALKAKFIALKAEFTQARSDYDGKVQSFNDRQKAYEAQVQYWNAKGGAPANEYNQLQAEKSSLDEEVSQINATESQINAMVDEINSLVVVLNNLADTLNLSVDKYNTIGTSRGESFEEGVYQSDGASQEIDIYEFSSRAKLVRVLAHELGHALGLEHVDDPKAIMYKFNQSTNETLTKADLDELKGKCGLK